MGRKATKAASRAQKKPPRRADEVVGFYQRLRGEARFDYCGFAAGQERPMMDMPLPASSSAWCAFFGFGAIAPWSVAPRARALEQEAALVGLGESSERRERDCGAYPNRSKLSSAS